MLGLAPMPAGAPIGHEMVGEIAHLFEGVTGYEIGERVKQLDPGPVSRCRPAQLRRMAH